jgi:hypothetical protein
MEASMKLNRTLSILSIVIVFALVLFFFHKSNTHILIVESHDSSRQNLPFLFTYFDKDFNISQDTFLVVRQTPYKTVINGSKYLIILKDTSGINPAIHAKLDNREIIFHNTTVIFTPGDNGVRIKNIL